MRVGEFDDFRGEVSVVRRWKAIGGAAVVLAAVGGGAAFAATQLDTPSARSQAIINDAAGQLGVQPDKLSSALKKALEDQLQADVTAGRLTQAQADAQKQRIESGNYPLLGTGGFGFGRGGSEAVVSDTAGSDTAVSGSGPVSSPTTRPRPPTSA